MAKIKVYLKDYGDVGKSVVKINLLFIFIFLNIWDFAIDRKLFNAMSIGIVMFGPATFLWFIGNFRTSVLVTLISLFEFLAMAIFIAEGLQLGGVGTTTKSIFWIPYLVMAGLNSYWGLKVYSKIKGRK